MSEVSNNQVNSEESNSESEWSNSTYISYGMAMFITQIFVITSGMWVFPFWEIEIGLAGIYIVLAYVISTLWDMINDPLIGYLSDKPRKFWGKYGRRFPWIVVSMFPHILIWILLFTAPIVGQLGLFFYFTAILLIVDTAFSAWDTNYNSLFPDKFRTQKSRAKASGIGVFIGQIAVVLGIVLPSIMVTYGDKASYFRMAAVIGLVSLIFGVLSIHGVRESKEMRDQIVKITNEEKEQESYSFFKMLKYIVKQKNIAIFLFLWVLWQSALKLITTSFNYFNQYILRSGPETLMLIGIPQFLGSLLLIPLWVKLIKKYGTRNLFIISGFGEGIAVAFFLFASDIIGALFISLGMGAFMGGLYVCLNPVYSDCMDEMTVKTGKRQEGIYFGVRTFFARTSFIIQAITITLAHELTGFNPVAGAEQTELAIWGIRVHIALVPTIFIFVGFIVFMKFFDLKGEKLQNIKKQLGEIKH